LRAILYFFEKSSEQKSLDAIYPRFSTYYLGQEYFLGESSVKKKERNVLAKKKANSEKQSFQDEMSLMKSL
jgi:hypothetical protein